MILVSDILEKSNKLHDKLENCSIANPQVFSNLAPPLKA
jgi:hypothetical protein